MTCHALGLQELRPIYVDRATNAASSRSGNPLLLRIGSIREPCSLDDTYG
jgi:hypothetical protein